MCDVVAILQQRRKELRERMNRVKLHQEWWRLQDEKDALDQLIKRHAANCAPCEAERKKAA